MKGKKGLERKLKEQQHFATVVCMLHLSNQFAVCSLIEQREKRKQKQKTTESEHDFVFVFIIQEFRYLRIQRLGLIFVVPHFFKMLLK